MSEIRDISGKFEGNLFQSRFMSNIQRKFGENVRKL